MRVWALVSCSGLLALAACSTEQASSPTPPADQPGDDAAQVQSRGGLAPVGSSSVAEPESGSKQLLTQGARSRLLARRTTPTISSPESAEQTLPQAAQLRERLQRLRAQQGSRLTARTPLVTVPLPPSVAQSSVAQGASPRPQAQSPVAVAGGSPTATPGSVSSAQNGQATVQPAITQSSGPSRNPTASAPTNTATGLGAPTAANIARSYPISPARHQGYSAWLNQPAPRLTTAVSGAPGAPGAQAVRLHGEAPAQTTAATNPPPALAPTAATPAPTAPDSGQASTSPAPTIAQPSPAAPPSGAAAGLAVTPSEP
jgi:hypothetical protein